MDYKKFVNNSVAFMSNYILQNNLKAIILGISGGIDSTVAACLASIACSSTKIPLIGRSLPTYTNNLEELNIARLVGQAFCDNFKEVSIEKLYSKFVNELEVNEEKMIPLQLGNIKARIRMIYLYNLASINKGCVLDTSNRTEHEIGFFTIHGDVGDLNCGLMYLWKTQIYELAKYLADEVADENNSKYYALMESINLTPTDGNGISSSDCEQFELENYKQVDDVLETMYYRSMFEQAFSSNDDQYVRLVDDYGINGVNRIMALHKNTKFKRKPAPIMPSLEELELVS